MSTFHTLLNRAYREIITEQEQPEQPPVAPEGAVPDQAQPTAVPEIQEQKPQTEALSSIGMVSLVRLLAKALMVERIKPEFEQKIVDIGDINENNAKDALKTLVQVMTNYIKDDDILDITF